jgi:RNA polymerase sigma factor (sigma-70 family)
MRTPIELGSDSLLPTRASLLTRLRDWQDQSGWGEFFETYWRLIYNVARGAGLSDADAQEVVQNTFIYLARRMPNFRYDRAQGSFKSWLRTVTRSRIQVFWRRQKPEEVRRQTSLHDQGIAPSLIENWPDSSPDVLDAIWQREWEENLLQAALRRVRSKVNSQQLLIFRLATFNKLPLSKVAKKVGVGIAQVYLARHRVAKLLKSEIEQLRRETE